VIRKGYVDVAGGQIHYRQRAGQSPAIVCFHQTASSSAMYSALMECWSGMQAIYALDTPGFGGSYDPPDQPSMAVYGDVMSEAIRGLGLGPVHLLGHHTGACVAVEIAARYPELVASLAMIGPVTITKEEAAFFKTVYPKDFRIRADGSHLARMWDYVASIGGNSSVDLHHREFVDTARAWAGHLKVYSVIWDQDFTSLYQAVKCPLAIMCSPGDVLWPMFARARALRPDAQVFTLGGSNFQPDEVPTEVARALRRFLGGA
jgi:pimeloyl-ACP methyl ester carboxylesterase